MYYDGIDIKQEIDLVKSNSSFLITDFCFKILFAMVVVIWRDLMLSVDTSDIAIINIKNVDYCCIIHNISKSEAIHLLENSVLKDSGYIWKILFWFLVYTRQCFYKLFFFFTIYIMVDNEYSMDISKSVKVSFRIVMKNPGILKFAPDHLKTNKMCKHAVTNL